MNTLIMINPQGFPLMNTLIMINPQGFPVTLIMINPQGFQRRNIKRDFQRMYQRA